MNFQTTFSEHLETQKNQWAYMEKVVLVQPEIDKLNIRIDADTYRNRGGNAWFDDLKIEKLDNSQNEIVSETNYYPFGLAHKGYNEQVKSSNLGENYKFNGKEEENEFDLGWTDYGARRLMRDLGRWTSVDALADKYTSLSPFSYTANNPILYVDPDGKRIKIANNTNKALTNLAMIAATSRGRQRLNSLISSSHTYIAKSTFWSSSSAYDGYGEVGPARTAYYVGTAWIPSVGGGAMSSLYAMGHELNHAYDHDVTNQSGWKVRKSRERSSVNFTNYLRSVHGDGNDLRSNYTGLRLKFSSNENLYNRHGESVTNFKQLDDLSSESNNILGFSYDTSTGGNESKTEYIISATTSDGSYLYVKFDNRQDYQDRLDYIRKIQEEQKKKDENE